MVAAVVERRCTFATYDGADLCAASRLRRLFNPLEGDAVPLWLLDPHIPVRLYIQRVERTHLDVLVLLYDTSRDLQRRRRLDGRRRRSSRIGGACSCCWSYWRGEIYSGYLKR